MSFVYGMARLAIHIANNTEATASILSNVDMEKIREAINTNDLKLAQANFNRIKGPLSAITYSPAYGSHPLQGSRLARFEYFAKKGLDHWFKEDPMDHWTNPNNIGGGARGWEYFADSVVEDEMHPKPVQKPEDAQILGNTVGRVTLTIRPNFF